MSIILYLYFVLLQDLTVNNNNSIPNHTSRFDIKYECNDVECNAPRPSDRVPQEITIRADHIAIELRRFGFHYLFIGVQ